MTQGQSQELRESTDALLACVRKLLVALRFDHLRSDNYWMKNAADRMQQAVDEICKPIPSEDELKGMDDARRREVGMFFSTVFDKGVAHADENASRADLREKHILAWIAGRGHRPELLQCVALVDPQFEAVWLEGEHKPSGKSEHPGETGTGA